MLEDKGLTASCPAFCSGETGLMIKYRAYMIVRGKVEHTSHVYEAKSDMGAKQVAMRWAVDIVPPRSRGLFDEEHRDFQALFEPSVNIEVSDDISVVVSGTTEYEGEPIIAGEHWHGDWR